MALFCRASRANQCPKSGENGLNTDMPIGREENHDTGRSEDTTRP